MPNQLPGCEAWLAKLEQSFGAGAAEGAAWLARWFSANGFTIGITVSDASIYARVMVGETAARPFYIRRDENKIELSLQALRHHPPFNLDSERRRLMREFHAIEGPEYRSTDNSNGCPSIAPIGMLNRGIRRSFVAFASNLHYRLTDTVMHSANVAPLRHDLRAAG